MSTCNPIGITIQYFRFWPNRADRAGKLAIRFRWIVLKNSPTICFFILTDIIRGRGIAMTGQQGGVQNQLFHSFNLEDYVPNGHLLPYLLRGIDQFFDLGDISDHLVPFL
jgi:hypothetical protein